jgi:N-sulfoglucosamine sulfohydrolase
MPKFKFSNFLILPLLAAATFSQAAEVPRPNILFAIADDWGRHAGAYGTKWVQTPAFDRVAKNGILFQRAYTPNAKCAPSRACILTGRNSWQLKEAANHICYFPPEFKGWAEALTEQGWFMGHTNKGWGPGVANDAAGKPRAMTGKAFNNRKAQPPTDEISTNDYAGNFNDFLEAAPKEKPWCFWYGAVEPHRGYEFGSGVAKGGKKLTDIDHVPAFWPDNETVRNDMLDYAFEIEHFDRHLGRMLDELAKRGQLENTLVIVTSDHGMPFPRSKGNAYELSNHVPLAAMWPKGISAPGRAEAGFVSFVDLAPTLIEVAGLTWQQTGMAPAAGSSLVPIFQQTKALPQDRDSVLIGKERTDIGRPHDAGYPVRAIIKGDKVYVRNFENTRWPVGNPETGYLDCDAGATKTFILDAHRKNAQDPSWALCFGMRPTEEFYDLATDPDCLQNLAAKPEQAANMKALREEMEAKLRAQEDPRMFGKGNIFDAYVHANKGNVGFYERFMKGEKLKTGWVSESDYEKLPLPGATKLTDPP